MRPDKWTNLEAMRVPGTRRILEGIRMVGRELREFDDDDDAPPKMHAGVLMKSRQDGGGGRPWE